MNKVTVQEIHDALNHTLVSMGEEAQDVLGIEPKPFEELSEYERAVLNRMTVSLNWIMSEFEVDA